MGALDKKVKHIYSCKVNWKPPEECDCGSVEATAELERLRDAARNLLEYRRRNTLNWQMEKADDYFRELAAALKD